ncbi:MAG: DeoR/GlpR family DNA-binding transcription regulator [Erysipelotrichaceae bacterium]|nr:DeoR/GlpR family DNA-binding transcription regulator [Erysipelotrichaceae bacterium]
MLPQERLEQIIQLVKKDGKVMVKDLSVRFDVTEDCIRKDLKGLELQGYLKRTYGGAVDIRNAHTEKNLELRIGKDAEHKMAIATKAYDTIMNRDMIFLDISTTNLLLARCIAQGPKQITVVTNMLDILNTLVHVSNCTVICCGGKLSESLHGFVGSAAIETIKNYHFDKAFIGSVGISLPTQTVSTFDMEDGIMKKTIMDHSQEVYLMLENKKFYTEGNYKFASLNQVDHIISEKMPEDEILTLLDELQIQIH